MKITMLKNSLFVIVFVSFVVFSAWIANGDQSGVTQTYKNATTPFDDAAQVDVVPVLPADIVQVNRQYQGGLFWTETRKDKIKRFKCSQCHNNQPVRIPRAAEMAHGEILLNHGGQVKSMSCYTCHKKDERDFLVTEVETKVDMDHSYQMCGQCHFRQHKDWVGGAHGKRVSYWAGQRVVKNCVSCHNPHSPRFEKRWPVTYSPPYQK